MRRILLPAGVCYNSLVTVMLLINVIVHPYQYSEKFSPTAFKMEITRAAIAGANNIKSEIDNVLRYLSASHTVQDCPTAAEIARLNAEIKDKDNVIGK